LVPVSVIAVPAGALDGCTNVIVGVGATVPAIVSVLGLRDTVDDEDLAGAADHRRVGREQPYWARAVNGDAFTRRNVGQFSPVITAREDVRQQREVVLVGLTVR
jgi:hypothetical protein